MKMSVRRHIPAGWKRLIEHIGIEFKEFIPHFLKTQKRGTIAVKAVRPFTDDQLRKLITLR
jgi:hypothetical protein